MANPNLIRYISIPAPGAHVLVTGLDQFTAVLEDDALPAETATASTGQIWPHFQCRILAGKSIQEIAQAQTWMREAARGGEFPERSVRFASGAQMQTAAARTLLILPAAVSAADQDALLKVLAEFYFYEHLLGNLEDLIDRKWDQAKADLPLASDVHSKDLARLTELAATTRAVWLARIQLAQMERPLLRTQLHLPPLGRKFAARLRRSAHIESRLETLDGHIECFEYIYEMANQRMGEYKNFRREFVVEILIAGLLTLELIVMVWEFVRHYGEAG